MNNGCLQQRFQFLKWINLVISRNIVETDRTWKSNGSVRSDIIDQYMFLEECRGGPNATILFATSKFVVLILYKNNRRTW